MKKLIALFIVFALCLGGAYAGESDMQKCTDGIIGKELFDLDDEYPDRVEAVGVGVLKCANGYIVYEVDDEYDRIVAAAGFDFSGALLCNNGMNLISAAQLENFAPSTSEELFAAFGSDYYVFNPYPLAMAWITDDGRIAVFTSWSGRNYETLCSEVYNFHELWQKKMIVETFDYEKYERSISRYKKEGIVLDPIKDRDDAVIKATRLGKEQFGDLMDHYKPLSAYYNPEHDVWMVKNYVPELPPNWALFGGDCYFFVEGKTGRVLAFWLGK